MAHFADISRKCTPEQAAPVDVHSNAEMAISWEVNRDETITLPYIRRPTSRAALPLPQTGLLDKKR